MDNDDKRLPFSVENMEIPIPPDNFIQIKMEKYNGQGEPMHNLNEYMTRRS